MRPRCGSVLFLTDLLLYLMQAVVTSARGVPLDVTTTKRPQAQPTTNGIAMSCGHAGVCIVRGQQPYCVWCQAHECGHFAAGCRRAGYFHTVPKRARKSLRVYRDAHVSRHEGGFSKDRIKKLYSRQGKKSTLTAIWDHLVKNHGGLASGPYKTFAKLPPHAVAQWRECGAPPNPIRAWSQVRRYTKGALKSDSKCYWDTT
jgi:hypothetical protein